MTIYDARDLRDIAKALSADGMRCNCDYDNWSPESNTGHTWVCRIHNKALSMKYHPDYVEVIR